MDRPHSSAGKRLPQLTSVMYVSDYTIHVRFDDQREGDIDLSGELWGEVFEPLKDLNMFKQLKLDENLGTVVWPNGADLAPEFLYERSAQD